MTPEQREEFDSLTVLAGSASALADTMGVLCKEIFSLEDTLKSLRVKQESLRKRIAEAELAKAKLVALKAPPAAPEPEPEPVLEISEEIEMDSRQL